MRVVPLRSSISPQQPQPLGLLHAYKDSNLTASNHYSIGQPVNLLSKFKPSIKHQNLLSHNSHSSKLPPLGSASKLPAISGGLVPQGLINMQEEFENKSEQQIYTAQFKKTGRFNGLQLDDESYLNDSFNFTHGSATRQPLKSERLYRHSSQPRQDGKLQKKQEWYHSNKSMSTGQDLAKSQLGVTGRGQTTPRLNMEYSISEATIVPEIRPLLFGDPSLSKQSNDAGVEPLNATQKLLQRAQQRPLILHD